MAVSEAQYRALLSGGKRGNPISSGQAAKHLVWIDAENGVAPGTSTFEDVADHLAEYLEDRIQHRLRSIAEDVAGENIPDF